MFKKFWSKLFYVRKIVGLKKLVPKKILGLKTFWVKKNFGLKKLMSPKDWIKIGSRTTELFMIWKKVVRTNIACTNVTVTFRICSRWSLEPIFKV